MTDELYYARRAEAERRRAAAASAPAAAAAHARLADLYRERAEGGDRAVRRG